MSLSLPREITPHEHRIRDKTLYPHDIMWLSEVANKPLDAEDLAMMNSTLIKEDESLAQLGTKRQSGLPNNILATRSYFYNSLLGFEQPNHPLHNAFTSYQRTRKVPPLPSSRVISTLRALNNATGNVIQAVQQHPAALSYSDAAIETKVNLLHSYGIDSVQVFSRLPAALGYSVANIESMLALYSDHGIDSTALIEQFPAALGYNHDAVATKLSLLRQYGAIPNNDSAITLIRDILSIPIESLLVYCADYDKDNKFAPGVASRVRRFMNKEGTGAKAERRTLLKENLPILVHLVGCNAVRVANHVLPPQDNPYILPGQTISESVLGFMR